MGKDFISSKVYVTPSISYSIASNLWNFIWYAHVSPRVKNFIQRTCKNIFLVKVNLKMKGYVKQLFVLFLEKMKKPMNIFFYYVIRPFLCGLFHHFKWHKSKDSITHFDNCLLEKILYLK